MSKNTTKGDIKILQLHSLLHILAVLSISFGLVSMETSKAHFLSGEKGGHCSLSMLVTVPRAQMHCP